MQSWRQFDVYVMVAYKFFSNCLELLMNKMKFCPRESIIVSCFITPKYEHMKFQSLLIFVTYFLHCFIFICVSWNIAYDMFSITLALGSLQRMEKLLKIQDCLVLDIWNKNLSKTNHIPIFLNRLYWPKPFFNEWVIYDSLDASWECSRHR